MIRVNKKNIFFSAVLALFFSVAFAAQVNASGASLYLSPNAGTFYAGGTFDVSIFVNTAGNSVNAVRADLRFDPRKLQLVNPTAGKSFISVWIAFPSYSNADGTLTFQGGVPTPGIKTSSGLVSTVTFRAIAPGETTISFLNSSRVLLDDGKGTDILNSMGRGVYLLSILAPEGPKIFSSTHPDMNKWYKNNNPAFSWGREEGVTDFSYSLDFDSQGLPDDISEGSDTSISYSDLKDGIWYFHIKAKKGGAWGGTSHYAVQIDRTWPAEFSIEVSPSTKTDSSQPIISFTTTDSLSEIDHFEVKTIDITPDNKENGGSFYMEAVSPYKMPPFKTGKYMIAVRAYDKAGNWRDETVKVEIVPRGIAVRQDGLWAYGFYFSWQVIVLVILILIMLIFLRIIYQWRKNRSEYRESLERLKEKEEELREQIKRLEN